MISQDHRIGTVRSNLLQVSNLLASDRGNTAIGKIVELIRVGVSCTGGCAIKAVDAVFNRVPDSCLLPIMSYLSVCCAQTIRQEQPLPLFVGAVPEPLLYSNVLIQGLDRIVYCLQLVPLVNPNVRNLLVCEISAQQCNYVGYQFSFIWIIEVVIVAVGVGVVLRWNSDVLNGSHRSYLSCSFIEEHLSQVFQHQSACYVPEPFSHCCIKIRVVPLPRVNHRQGCPKHLAVVKRRCSVLKIPCRLNLVGAIQGYPGNPSTKTWISFIEILIGFSLLRNQIDSFFQWIDSVSVLMILKYFCDYPQVQRLFATGAKHVLGFIQQLSTIVVHPLAIICKP